MYQNPKDSHTLRSRTNKRTYPQIFINDLSVGGYEDLLALEEQSRLPGINKPGVTKSLGKTLDNASMRYHRVLINLAAGQKSSALS